MLALVKMLYHNEYTDYSKNFVLRCTRKKLLHAIFIITVIFAMFFSEFVLAFSSPHQPIQAYAYFLDNNKGNNAIANALGKITITENAHLLLKGSGRYTLDIRDTNGTVLFFRKGIFNKTGYAEIIFRISPEKFKVGETYNIRINATDNPFPLFYRYAEAYVKFTVERDYPTIALGAVRDGNQTVITARIFTSAGPLKNKKIYFAYKQYNEKEKLKRLGFAFSDEEGRATLVTNILNEKKLYLVVAEFYGDDSYKPSAAAQPYSPIIGPQNYERHDALLDFLNKTNTAMKKSTALAHTNKATRKDGMGRIIGTSMSYKTSELESRFSKTTASDRIKSNVNSTYTFEFIETNLASLSLVEFLKRITTDDTPASALINVANILMNLDDIPFVIAQTQELLSKLQVPLIPDIAHSSLTEIRLYRSTFYTETVEKTIVEKHTETYTVTKKVSKKVAYTKTITKRIKVRVQYIAYEKRTRREMVFVRRPRPHWQVVYVTEYKPVTKWKYVWKTVKQTVTRYKTVTYTVTEKKTRTYYTHKTVNEKVKKEKREYFKIILTDFTVINEQTGERMSLQQFFLFVMGFREDTLSMIIRYMEAKVFGPALDMLQQFIDFLININKRFLRTLIEKLFDELRRLIYQGLTIHMVKTSSPSKDDTTDVIPKKNEDIDYLFAPSGKWGDYPIEPADRPLNAWDSAWKLHAPKASDIAESTKIAIDLGIIEAQTLELITGKKDVVIMPATNEVLVYVYDEQQNGNKQQSYGWLDLNHYDHTIAKCGDFSYWDWTDSKPKTYSRKKGYISLGVTRTTYIILVPDNNVVGGRKIVIGYSIDVIDNDAKLVPEPLKKFPDIVKGQSDNTRVSKITESMHREYDHLLKNVLGTEKLETYADLREAVSRKYGVNVKEIINSAVESSKVSGIEILKLKSGDTLSTFLVVNPDYKWIDSEGNQHTPIEVSYSLFTKETGSRTKYDVSDHVLRGFLGPSYKGVTQIKDYFVKVDDAVDIGKAIFYRLAYIAKKNDIPANGIIHVISPPLLNEIKLNDDVKAVLELEGEYFSKKIKDIDIRGDYDKFKHHFKALVIVNPRYANPAAAILLDLFRAFAEDSYFKTMDSIGKNYNYKLAQIKLFRMAIIDAYREAIKYEVDPEDVVFKVNYEAENKIKTVEISLFNLMKHYDDFGVKVGGNDRKSRIKSIEINNEKIPVDKLVEGFMHIKVKQRDETQRDQSDFGEPGTVMLYQLDEETLAEKEEIVFHRKVIEDKKSGKRKYRHISLSQDSDSRDLEIKGLALWRYGLSRLIDRTRKICFDKLVRKTSELKFGFFKLMKDARHLGQEPSKSAEYLLLLLVEDTKGRSVIFNQGKQYIDTVVEDMMTLQPLQQKLDELLKNDKIKKAWAEQGKLEFAKDVHKKISEMVSSFENDEAEFMIDYFRSLKKAATPENPKSIKEKRKIERGKAKLSVAIKITKEFLKKLLGEEEKEVAKQLGTTIAVGTIVGLIFPRVVGEAIMTLDFAMIEEMLDRDPKSFFDVMANHKTRLVVGLCLSAVTFVLLNMDADRFIKAAKDATENTNHKSSLIGEFLDQMFNVKMVFATFLSGLGMILEALFGAPFYTTEEIANEISKLVHEKLGDTAGIIWDSTAGYKIPGLDMTGFEAALTVILEGNGGIIELITTAVTKIVEYFLSEIIKPIVEPLIAEYTYYIAAALLL